MIQSTLWMSTRAIRNPQDESWSSYLNFIGRHHLREVRSVDSWCNPYVEECGDLPFNGPEEAWRFLNELPQPDENREYRLVFQDARIREPIVDPHFSLMGHDLSDETHTSSLLNCGRWTGRLHGIAERSLPNGLLTLEDAITAQLWLREDWPNDGHGRVTVWALYEFRPG